MASWKTVFLYKPVVFHFHDCFREGMLSFLMFDLDMKKCEGHVHCCTISTPVRTGFTESPCQPASQKLHHRCLRGNQLPLITTPDG